MNCVLCLLNNVHAFFFIFVLDPSNIQWETGFENFTHGEEAIWGIIFKYFVLKKFTFPPVPRERRHPSVILHHALVWKVAAVSEYGLIKFSLSFVFHNKLTVIFRSWQEQAAIEGGSNKQSEMNVSVAWLNVLMVVWPILRFNLFLRGAPIWPIRHQAAFIFLFSG